MKKIMKILRNPKIILLYLLDSKIGRIISDKVYLKFKYELIFEKKLNLDNPKTFNEKLQWLKLNDRNPEYTKMVDKYDVKKHVANIIGQEYIIPTLGIYEKFDDINFNKLPNQFVIKCTHDSGGLVIVKDKSKLDIKQTKKEINKCLKRNYYYLGREFPYKNIKPRIIIEKYMSNNDNSDIKDYKFFVFNGNVKCFKVDFNRFFNHQANYYDRDGKLLKFGEEICPPDFNEKVDMPNNIYDMIILAEKLSNKNLFVRIDFYNINEKIYFGEITFYPAAGFGKFIPESYDEVLGSWLNINR